MNTPSSRPAGFTLIELIVVVGVCAALGLLLLPALASARTSSRASECLNNNRQLCLAWRLYSEENGERLVFSGGTGLYPTYDAYAWTLTHMDFNPSNRGNWDTNADMVKRPLWPYTGRNAAIYKCPADRSSVVVNGVPMPRILSMSMNYFLGGLSDPTAANWPSYYCTYTNLADINGARPGPGPAKLWVFLDMREDSINWGNFLTDMTGFSPSDPASYQFTGDLPGAYHNQGCGVSFADGHGEMHRWLDPRTTPPLGSPPTGATPSPNNLDVAWLQAHTTRVR